MSKLFIPIALKTALTPLLTRKLFFGMAISCVIGIGLGAWLEPPSFQAAAAATTVTLPQEQPNPWSGDASSVSSQPDNQPISDPNWPQSAAVSPPADPEPLHLAQADEAQVAASGDTSQAQQSTAIAPVGYDVRAKATGQPDPLDPPAAPIPPSPPAATTADDTTG